MSKTKETEFKPTGKMYTTLFNGITDAREQLKKIDEHLSQLQQEAELMYIEDDK